MIKNPRTWTEGRWSTTTAGAVIPDNLPDFLFLHLVHERGPGKNPFCVTAPLCRSSLEQRLAGTYFGETLPALQENRAAVLPRWFWRKIPSPLNRPLI